MALKSDSSLSSVRFPPELREFRDICDGGGCGGRKGGEEDRRGPGTPVMGCGDRRKKRDEGGGWLLDRDRTVDVDGLRPV